MTFEAGVRKAGRDTGLTGGRARLRLYVLGLLVSFALHALVHGLSGGVLSTALSAAVLAGLAAALALPAAPPFLVGGAALLAALVALAFPLGARVLEDGSVPAAIRDTAVWPQVLVTLFASRVLAELCDLRFAAFWREPLRPVHHPRTQSLLSATLLGLSLALLFYQVTEGFAVAPARLDPLAIAWRAFTGQTAIHVAIVVLFFVTLAAIGDAALLTLNDGSVLDALRRLCRTRLANGGTLTRRELRELAEQRLEAFGHSRTIQFVRGASSEGPGFAPATARPLSLAVFHAASRRLIRALVSFLPLLGFLGTVIGLAAAIGALPTDFGPGSGAGVDIGGSLSGLAVKFETTLLGLSGGLVASLLLAVVERREAELAGECARLVESVAREP